jgi:hypothetical protein
LKLVLPDSGTRTKLVDTTKANASSSTMVTVAACPAETML